MYSCHIKKQILFGLVFTLGLCGYVLGNDLANGISTKFKDAYNEGLADKYLDIPYESSYSKDPFGDAMRIYEGMSSQTKVAGVKYVEQALALNNCGLSQEKQWAIEYYFLPEFRSEIVRNMKMEGGDFDSKKYTFDEDEIMDYCTEFYNCIVNKSGESDDTQKITSGTPENIKTNCKEFFQTNYREGWAEEKRVQNLQIGWLGNDKYVNAITDESPHDVMSDLGVIGGLSYLQAQSPLTPVFYDLSVFAKYKEALLNYKDGGNECVEESYGGVVPEMEGVSLGGSSDTFNVVVLNGGRELVGGNTQTSSEGVSLGGGGQIQRSSDGGLIRDVGGIISSVEYTSQTENTENNTTNGVQISDGSIRPLPQIKALSKEYDDLIDGLGAYRLNDDNAYYGSLCRDEEEKNQEPEPEFFQEEQQTIVPRDEAVWTEEFNLSKEEYQELVDYMMDAVTSYASLPEEKAKEIEAKAGDVSRYNGVTSAEQTEAVAKKVLNCYQSCVGLSIDRQFECMLRCSCGEIESPIFNPDINPGMGPIFIIRYCAVPAVNPRYFYGGSNGTDGWTSTLISSAASSSNGSSRAGNGGSNNGGSNGNNGGSKGNSGGSKGNSGGGSNGGGNNGGSNGSSNGSSNGGVTCGTDGKASNAGIVNGFNRGGINMKAMEEGTNEILGVVEKLAREGRLGIWTQQRNHLDSSTKMMDVADTFSFTISASKKRVGDKVGEPTDEYKNRIMKNKDNNWLSVTHVSNPIDSPATRNYYSLVSQGESAGDHSSSVNANVSKQAQGYLNVAPGFIVDQSENSNTARYVEISELFSDWLDDQGDFWAEKLDYLRDLDSYAKSLYAKKA